MGGDNGNRGGLQGVMVGQEHEVDTRGEGATITHQTRLERPEAGKSRGNWARVPKAVGRTNKQAAAAQIPGRAYLSVDDGLALLEERDDLAGLHAGLHVHGEQLRLTLQLHVGALLAHLDGDEYTVGSNSRTTGDEEHYKTQFGHF